MGLVIFDLDGTLIDTVPLITRCFQKVFRKYGHRELTDEQVHAMFGPGESVIFAREFGERWPEILADYLECYQAGHDTVTLSPEIVGVLDGLAHLGIKMAIVTNKERDTTDITLAHFNLRHYFIKIVTAKDVAHPKPSPEGINLVLNTCEENSADAIMIGDTNNDREAALASDVPFIRALWFVPSSEWDKDTTEVKAETIHDLKEILPYEL